MTYTAEIWGSHKSEGNDDCFTGDDFETLEEAKAFIKQVGERPAYATEWAYACVIGPDGLIHEETNPNHVVTSDDDSADRSEFAMQQGMAHGAKGYNEAMGYDQDEPDDQAGFGPGSRR